MQLNMLGEPLAAKNPPSTTAVVLRLRSPAAEKALGLPGALRPPEGLLKSKDVHTHSSPNSAKEHLEAWRLRICILTFPDGFKVHLSVRIYTVRIIPSHLHAAGVRPCGGRLEEGCSITQGRIQA